MQKLLAILFILINFNINVKAQTCTGLQTFTTCTGSFDDGSGASNYSNYLNCYYLIEPTNAANVTITISNFSTEQSYDFLYVWDGNSGAAPFLGGYSGSLSTFSITSTTGALYLKFETEVHQPAQVGIYRTHVLLVYVLAPQH